jgi:hypothetical protein
MHRDGGRNSGGSSGTLANNKAALRRLQSLGRVGSLLKAAHHTGAPRAFGASAPGLVYEIKREESQHSASHRLPGRSPLTPTRTLPHPHNPPPTPTRSYFLQERERLAPPSSLYSRLNSGCGCRVGCGGGGDSRPGRTPLDSRGPAGRWRDHCKQNRTCRWRCAHR